MAIVKDLALEKAIQNRFGRKYKVTSSKNGTDYLVCCPFCLRTAGKPDTKYKMHITPSVGIYHCFRCDASGAIQSMFKDLARMRNTPEAVEHILPLPNNIQGPGDMVALNQLPDNHVAIRYIKGRGFDPDSLTHNYGIMYCSRGRTFGGPRGRHIFDTTNTIIFPMIMDGKSVGWQARLLYNPESAPEDQYEIYGYGKNEDGEYIVPPKYLTSPGLDKGRILFNYDNARKFEFVTICEGTFDAIKVGLNGVATLGKGVTDNQMRLLKSYWRFAIILLDPGDADTDMRKLEANLKISMPCIRIDLVGYKDAGEAPTNEIWDQIINQMAKHGYDPKIYLR